MAKKRAKILETRYFGFIIAALIVLLTLLVHYETGLLQPLELRIYDSFFKLKNSSLSKTVQVGSVYTEQNPKISSDVLIVGIDENTLSKYGLWPFPRSRHADLINAFSRIKDPKARESSILLDVFFFEETGKPVEDGLLATAIKDSGRVFLESKLDVVANDVASADAAKARQEVLDARYGTITNVHGPWRDMISFHSVEAPLEKFSTVARGYGHASYNPDRDNIFRRQPLVAKYSVVLETLRLDSIKPGFAVNDQAFERLVWEDKDGIRHNVPNPVTDKALAELKRAMEADAPKKVDDTGGAGEGYFVVTKYKDSFIPSITLALALNYFGKTIKDLEVFVGERIRIPAPTRFDPETGERKPYEIQTAPDKVDKDGNVVTPGPRRTVPNIDIPIDSNCMMLINFMGPPSSAASDGLQTFPVRSYAGYADRAPGPDPAKWRRTMAAGNKILMVGAFSTGMASDDKQTPLGIMFGIELHANALNTILMDNFITHVPDWVDVLLLAALVFGVAFMSSRLSTLLSFFGTLIIVVALFFAINFVFDERAMLVTYSSPAIAMIFTFIAIVVYRAMTEERDKRAIRETFGKYLSPKVVDQLVENPPELGGVDKELTVLFSDIRSFTTLSESMSPQELVNHLNGYLTAMTDIILEYGGYLDKYVGDEIMCFWGAPLPQADHAVLGCKCALRQMERLRELNQQWPEAIRINIGIGLNSGIMTVGNMGSPARMNYTLMGDNVNLGARLEGTNKEYGSNIIISEYTYGLVKDHFIVRELDNIRVKGKNKPVLIYELVDAVDGLAPPPLFAGGKGTKK